MKINQNGNPPKQNFTKSIHKDHRLEPGATFFDQYGDSNFLTNPNDARLKDEVVSVQFHLEQTVRNT